MVYNGPAVSAQRSYPLPHPDAPSARADVQRILDALLAIDSDIGGILAALDSKATPADVTAAVDALVAGAPAALDTLNELAAKLGSSDNAIAALTAQIAGKADAAHTHAIAEVSGLQGALDEKAGAAHGHRIDEVAGLEDALDEKALKTEFASSIARLTHQIESEAPGLEPLALIEDRKAPGVAGGTFTAGDWRTRDLNTLGYDAGRGVIVANNQVTLNEPGLYLIKWTAPAYRVGTHQSRLYDITNEAPLQEGSLRREYAYNSNDSAGQYVVSVTSPITLEVQHLCQLTKANDGFGANTVFPDSPPIYSQMEVHKFGGTNSQAIDSTEKFFDFTKAEAASLIACSRASTGWADQADGTLVEFAPHAPRITDQGLLIEEARTNLAPISGGDTNAFQFLFDCTVSISSELWRDGATPLLTLTSTAASGRAQRNINFHASPNAFFCFSVDIKKTAASQVAGLFLNYGGGTVISATCQIDLLDGSTPAGAAPYKVEDRGAFWRVAFRLQNNASVNSVLSFAIHPVIGGIGTCDIAGLQFEEAPFPSSFIKTTGAAATRAADDVSFIEYSWLTPATGTFLAETAAVADTALPHIFDDTGKMSVFFKAAQQVQWGDADPVLQATMQSGAQSEIVKTALAWDVTGRSMAVNGGAVATDAAAITAGAVRLGNSASLDHSLNGYLQALTYWSQRKSDSEIGGLTT